MKISEFLILESLRTARERYGNNPDFEQLVPLDPNPNKFKYIEWIANKFYSEEKPSKEQLQEYVKKFDILSNRNKIQPNDIIQYKTFADLKNNVDKFSEGINLEKTDKQIKYDVERILPEHPDLVIVSPKNHRASNHFSFGSRWCTALNDNDTFWNRYINEDQGKLYYIRKKSWGGPDLIPDWEKNKRPITSSPDEMRNTAILVQQNGERSFWDYEDDNITDKLKGFLKTHKIDIKTFKKTPFVLKPGKDFEDIWHNDKVKIMLAKSQRFVADYIDDFFEKVYGGDWGHHWNNRTRSGDEFKFFNIYKPYMVSIGTKTYMYLIKEGYDYIDIYDSHANLFDDEKKKSFMAKLKELGVPKEALISYRSSRIKEKKTFRNAHESEIKLIFENDDYKIIEPTTFEAFQLYGTKSWYSNRRGSVVKDAHDLNLKKEKGIRIYVFVPKYEYHGKYCFEIGLPQFNSKQEKEENIQVYTTKPGSMFSRKREAENIIGRFEIPKSIFEFSKEDLFWDGILNSQYNTVEYALENGVNPNMKKDGKEIGNIIINNVELFGYGNTPIRNDWINLFEKYKVPWNKKDKDGNNLLMKLTEKEKIYNYIDRYNDKNNDLEFFSRFNPKDVNNSGDTVCHIVAKTNGYFGDSLLKILFKLGYRKNLTTKNNNGKTPIQELLSSDSYSEKNESDKKLKKMLTTKTTLATPLETT